MTDNPDERPHWWRTILLWRPIFLKGHPSINCFCFHFQGGLERGGPLCHDKTDHTYHDKWLCAYESKQAHSTSIAQKVLHFKTEFPELVQQGFGVWWPVISAMEPVLQTTTWVLWLLLLSLRQKTANVTCVLEKKKKEYQMVFMGLCNAMSKQK